MATEKLYELHEEADFDLVVVDTPPTRNALDFLDAPDRLTRFLDHRLYRVLMTPTRAYLQGGQRGRPGVPAHGLRRWSAARCCSDAIAFFQAFDGMEQGFRERAERVLELLTAPDTAFVLVASPRADTVEEASFFAAKLAENDVRHRGPGRQPRCTRRSAPGSAAAAPRPRPSSTPAPPLGRPVGQPGRLPPGGRARAGGAGRAWPTQVAPAPVVTVPFLRSDVHDLDGLAEIGRHLFGRPTR